MNEPPESALSLELLGQAQAGDAAALDGLLRRYEDRLRRVIRVRLDAQARRSLDSADLVQETFMAALTGIPTLQAHDRGAILAWLTRIAENELIDARRRATAARRDRRRDVPLDGAPIPEARAAAPEEAAAAREQKDLVDAAVAKLTESHREVIVRRTYLGLSWDEVARQLGCPSADAARQLHRRATIALAKQLDSGAAPAAD
jgi:RNA polymerase sigma-70 factor (ECF subfamily)